MPPERRKHVRRAPEIGTRFTCMSATAASSGTTTVRTNVAVKLLDLSDKGAGIVTNGRLRVGAELLVRLFIDGTDDLYGAKAVVRWAETWNRNGREADLAGLEFMQVQELRGQRFRFLASWASSVPLAGEEKRKQKRRLLETSKLKCTETGLFSLLGLAANVGLSLIDLSEGGCQIMPHKKLDTGAKVRLNLCFQNPGVEFGAPGEVRWCNRETLSLDPRFKTGISFGALSHDEEGRLSMILRAMDAVER